MSSSASVSSSIIENAREIRNRRLARRKEKGDSNPFLRRRSQSFLSVPDSLTAPRSPVARAVNRIQTSAGSPKYRRPPIVSPNMPLSPCKSFEDERQPRLLPRRHPSGSDRSVMSDLGYQPYGIFENRSFDSDLDVNEEIDPELRSLTRAVDTASPRRGMSRPPMVPMGIDVAADRRSPHLVTNDDDVSSLGGVEDHVPGLHRITAAIRNQSSRPPNLSSDEKALWDAVQFALRSKRIPEDASDHDDDDLGKEYFQAKYKDAEEQLIAQQQEQDRALRAIQRVLADVTAERDKAVAELKERPNKESKSWQDQKTVMQKDLDTKLSRIHSLERQLKLARVSNARLRTAVNTHNSGGGSDDETKVLKELEVLKEQVHTLHEEKQDLVSQLQAKDEQISVLMRNQEMAGSLAAESDNEALQKALDEKTSALENAKMIIASLESASGSLATGMREKLKAKQDELATAKAESAQKQKRLDTLAKELRDLQRKQARQDTRRQEKQTEERSQRVSLTGRLEKNMADIRAASVILEATHDDTTAMNEISDVLGESINALKATIDAIDDADNNSETDDTDNRSAFSQSSDREFRTRLEEKSALVKKLEEDLRKQKDEALQIRLENEKSQQRRDEEMQALHGEIHSLREQCATNMEVLMKKERELAVLRDSLKVEDDDVGYISDDASDSDEDDDRQLSAVDTKMSSSVYGPVQAEALATLLVHSAPGMDVSGGSFNENETLRRQLVQAKTEHEKASKQLKSEKESLANAKMIISSLEKANKSMMEDLRSRLQDSNTAIASLLEKSMESEKTTTSLRNELEELRKQKEELQTKLGSHGSASFRDDVDGFPRGAIVSYDEKKEEITETID